MLNHRLYSYRLSISNEHSEPVTCTVPEILKKKNRETFESEYIDEWQDVDDYMQKISKQCPDAIVSLLIREKDNPAMTVRRVWSKGLCIQNSKARVISPDEYYDKVTVDAIEQILRMSGEIKAANMIVMNFK